MRSEYTSTVSSLTPYLTAIIASVLTWIGLWIKANVEFKNARKTKLLEANDIVKTAQITGEHQIQLAELGLTDKLMSRIERLESDNMKLAAQNIFNAGKHVQELHEKDKIIDKLTCENDDLKCEIEQLRGKK